MTTRGVPLRAASISAALCTKSRPVFARYARIHDSFSSR